MTGPLGNLNAPCPACGRPSGDHTLREWSVCIATPTTDLPFQETPPDMASAAADAVRQRFQLDDDFIIADHIVAKALVLDGSSGLVSVRLPALLHEFQVGVAGQPPSPVAKVVYLGDPATMRKYGRLLRDTANGAANAGERAA